MQIFDFLIAGRRLIGKRMMLADKFMQSFLQHMRIDLRRGYVGMAKQLLHGAQIGPVLQQMAGKGVTKDMR